MSEVERTDNEQKDMEAILTEARFKFAMKSLAKIVSLKKEETWFFSPLTIFEILCIIYTGSESTDEDVESIEKNLGQILHLSDVSKDNLTQYYSQQKFSCQEDSTKYETSCWITNSKVLSDTVQHLYRDKMETADFSTESSSDVLNRINSSLKNMMMPVELSNITESMEIFLSSALYSSLEYMSLIQANTERKFRTLRSTDIGMIMNEIPYNNNLSIFLLFPTGVEQEHGHIGICSDLMLLVLKLTTEDGMAELRRMLDNDESNPDEFMMIKIDELDVRLLNDIPIEELLKSLNVEKLMESNKAILHRFVAKDEQLHLGDAIHRAFIAMNSREVVAKAVTTFFTKSGGSFKPKVELNIDTEYQDDKDKDTFVFLIYDKNNRKILFIGVMNDDISYYQNLEPSVYYEDGSKFDYEDKSDCEYKESEYECYDEECEFKYDDEICEFRDESEYQFESPNSKK